METMTNRRVYVTIDNRDNISAITYYDEENKRSKQIDLMHPHKNMIPHTHHGYLHNENDGAKGAANLTPKEKRMVESVTDKWYNRRGKCLRRKRSHESYPDRHFHRACGRVSGHSSIREDGFRYSQRQDR